MTTVPLPAVLIVDDDAVVREALKFALENDFQLNEAASGEETLAYLASPGSPSPDLILLDIEMQQLTGYETCRRLRADGHAMPLIFISSHDTLEERLEAFDAGGNDFISKPFDPEVLLRKSRMAVQTKRQAEGLQQVTQRILHEVGETGVLLAFLRETTRITDYEALASLLLKAVCDYGVRAYVQLRHDSGAVTLTPSLTPTQLELSILERATALDHKFRLGRRLVINYHHISLMVVDMPDDAERTRRLTDYIDVLVESAEAVAETIGMRRESAARAEALMVATAASYGSIESLREGYRTQQADTRRLLQELTEEVESTYVHLGLTENQEETISSTLRLKADTILKLFDQNVEFDRKFAAVLDSLQPQTNANADVWL
jgi:DNA-binding response OmpR family regulator